MRDIKYYKNLLAAREERRSRYLRSGRYGEMQQLDDEIEELKQRIADMAPKPVIELFSREQIQKSGLIPAVLEIHLAADYLAACCYTVEDIVDKLGAHAVTVIPELRDVIKRANEFCNYLYETDASLADLITDDETLMMALHKKTMSYMKQRMTSTPKTESNQKQITKTQKNNEL